MLRSDHERESPHHGNGEDSTNKILLNEGTTIPLERKKSPAFDLSKFQSFQDSSSNALHTDFFSLPHASPTECKKATLLDFDNYRVTVEKNVPQSKVVVKIGEAPAAAQGNITAVTAEGKAGKTAATSVIIAGAISKDGNVDGFEHLSVEPNRDGKAVIHIDTEQAEADQQYNLKKTLERAGLQSTPEYLHSYNIRTLPLADYQSLTWQICELCSRQFFGIHMIVVDGGADYITSVNDEAEANAIVTYFTTLAVTYKCPVIIVIHLNENAGKNGDTLPRGHLGRQAVRKGYAQLNITKENDISTLQVLRARRAATTETPLICFRYDKEKGYHTSIDSTSVSSAKKTEKDEAVYRRVKAIAEKVFAPPSALRHKDAIPVLMKTTKKSQPTAKRYLNDMVGWGLVSKGDDDCYRLALGS